MADPRLSSPAAFRLVAVAAAAVASLGFVALGVQLGTDGLGSDGPGRNPGSATASPAAAVVDLARTRPPSPTLEEQFITLLSASLAPGVGSTSSGSPPVDAGSGTGSDAPAPPSGDPVPPTTPDDPPAVVPPGPPPIPDPILPDPGPLPDPVAILDPIVDPVLGGLTGTDPSSAGLSQTIDEVLGL